ncbi:MAG: ABC transporter permease [Salana multivorans]|uniref:methionine ABC transporter permease n=1 Tax=Salana multivorans TaxID=120377 RepID=UPI00095EB240|nr:methionine ABC transporter permease [Salana multivorans]MBN8883794.1 ABC transporter permease [Salana multivorans]OJX93767.1 MAG: methionine ABC transporter ATP-binding protein [Micrococcales bacterium 73-15]
MNWERLGPPFWKAVAETGFMVGWTMLVGGLIGLVLGIGLYLSRRGGMRASTGVFTGLNVLVNIVRPIPFIIFLFVLFPVTKAVVGTTIGTAGATFPMLLMAGFAFSRLVEQNLLSIDPGVIEAARAMGAGTMRIITTVLIPEALAPLILGYAFLFVGVIDMSAMAGMVGGGGLGDFAIKYGYQQFNWPVTFFVVVVIVGIVQLAQLLANVLARKALHR